MRKRFTRLRFVLVFSGRGDSVNTSTKRKRVNLFSASQRTQRRRKNHCEAVPPHHQVRGKGCGECRLQSGIEVETAARSGSRCQFLWVFLSIRFDRFPGQEHADRNPKAKVNMLRDTGPGLLDSCESRVVEIRVAGGTARRSGVVNHDARCQSPETLGYPVPGFLSGH